MGPSSGVAGHALPVHHGDGSTMTRKYTIDFLLTLSEQCTDLSAGLVLSDIADLLKFDVCSVPVNDRDLSTPGRVIDRPSRPRNERRGGAMMDIGGRWGKNPGGFPPGREMGPDSSVFRYPWTPQFKEDKRYYNATDVENAKQNKVEPMKPNILQKYPGQSHQKMCASNLAEDVQQKLKFSHPSFAERPPIPQSLTKDMVRTIIHEELEPHRQTLEQIMQMLGQLQDLLQARGKGVNSKRWQ